MQPTPEEVRSQLERLLASECLAATARLRRFLDYVVERTLAGEGGQLKEYSVGLEVFDRGEQYDPRIDSIVRVEAGRLRAKLDEYYSTAGRADPVVLRIPRGSYVPVFERRPEAPPVESSAGSEATRSRARWLPAVAVLPAAVVLLAVASWWTSVEPAGGKPAAVVTVAVVPFAQYSTDPADALLAARITDGVTAELVRDTRLAVVSRASTLQMAGDRRPLREVAQALNANMVVEASVLIDGDRVRVQARLVDPMVDRKVSLHEFDGTRQDLDDLQRRVAGAIAAGAYRALSR